MSILSRRKLISVVSLSILALPAVALAERQGELGAIKAGLEKAFRLPDAPPLEKPQKQDASELSESERSTVLSEHPGV